MDIYGNLAVNSFSRTSGNELAKGYYPTDPQDLKHILSSLEPSYGFKARGDSTFTLSILDPCAGEGRALASIKRHFISRYNPDAHRPHEICTYAVEIDQQRYAKIKGTAQKSNASFFDTDIKGSFNFILLNPPYNKADRQTLQWVKECTRLLTHQGYMALIIPDYEFESPQVREYIDRNFGYIQVFKSENYAQFKQLVVFLSKGANNRRESYSRLVKSNFESGQYPTFTQYRAKHFFKIQISGINKPIRPTLASRDMEPVYKQCAERVDGLLQKMLERVYPSKYDQSIKPLTNLRVAHAIQLAALNSQVESVKINGTCYLAKYRMTKEPETFADPETSSETTVFKPKVEAFLMDQTGSVQKARALGFDYFELNNYLSEILLRKLSRLYLPLYETGSDPEFLKEKIEQIGLLPPQREAVKALLRGYEAGYRGLICRANTGTGKSWVAKAIKLLSEGVERSIMLTEPHLIEQMKEEYANDPFDLHIVDSWEKAKNLSLTRPKGLYLVPYSRIRMHPKYRPALISVRRMCEKKGARTYETNDACPNCFSPVENRPRKSEKAKCFHCDQPLYTYVPENKRPAVSFGQWIRQIESGEPVREVKTQNRQLPYIRLLNNIGWDLAIIDECHNAANMESNQGAAFLRLAAKAKKVLALTATLANGMAKSLYNILWGVCPDAMVAAGWDRNSVAEFQAEFGAFKQVRKNDDGNRHRSGDRIKTHDIPGISPTILSLILPFLVNMASEDFDDMPPVHREVVRCASHEKADEAIRQIDKVLDDAKLPPEDKLAALSVKANAMLRVFDTFHRFDDNLTLRNVPLGTVTQVPIIEPLLEKEEHLVRLVNEARARGERVLVYTGKTQKIDIRLHLSNLVRKYTGASVEILTDNIPPKKIVRWFRETAADVVVAGFKRCGTGLNLSQFTTLIWYDYTNNSRLADQGDGRIRRVNTAQLMRKMFGEVRTCRYYYLVCGEPQSLELSNTLEKRLVSSLIEGEVPEIDPSECSSGAQSFQGMLISALRSGKFNYTDPSELLRRMTQIENGRIRKENLDALKTPTRAVETGGQGKMAPSPNFNREKKSLFDEDEISQWPKVANGSPTVQLDLF